MDNPFLKLIVIWNHMIPILNFNSISFFRKSLSNPVGHESSSDQRIVPNAAFHSSAELMVLLCRFFNNTTTMVN